MIKNYLGRIVAKKPGLFYCYNVLARCVLEMEIITNSRNNPYIFTSGENLLNVFKVTKISTLITFPLKLIKLVNK